MDYKKLIGDIDDLLIAHPSENVSKMYLRKAADAIKQLISHGVTVQEWISVKDRLPEKDGAYLVTTNSFGDRQSVKLRWFAKDGENVDAYDLAGQKDVWYLYDIECGYVSINSVTHWMPLPLPPKGE